MVHRHTLNIEAELLKRAAELRPDATTTALVNAGLRALIERDAAERLANMEGISPDYQRPSRSPWHKPSDPDGG